MKSYDIQSIIRDIQLNSVIKKMIIKPNIKKIKKGNNIIFNKPYWSIIEKYKDDCIITGSLALSAYEMIKRVPKDIDLIVLNKDIKLPKLYDTSYLEEESISSIGSYEEKGFTIDFFSEENPCYIELNGYKFEHPVQILIKKSKLSRNSRLFYTNKDVLDIIESYENIKYE